jgi:hypothetical protein
MMNLAALTTYPQRIICLTEETTETLYLLGEQDRIVGVSGYTVRPKEARQKSKVSAFINAKFDKIIALEPDLVLAFSDLQAEIAAELIRRGVTVLTFNQRSVAAILQMILTLGRITGCEARAVALVSQLQTERDAIKAAAASFPHRPRVYFEEWSEPLISGIRRALGARRRDVRNQVLLEAVTLTGAGGLIGILLGFAFALLVGLTVSFPANVPLWAIAAGLLTCSRACNLPCVRRDRRGPIRRAPE